MAMKFSFKILWRKNSLGIALNKNHSSRNIPLTCYYFWPRDDVWEQIRIEINSKPWISRKERVLILNKVTEVINNWQRNLGKKNSDIAIEQNINEISIASN